MARRKWRPCVVILRPTASCLVVTGTWLQITSRYNAYANKVKNTDLEGSSGQSGSSAGTPRVGSQVCCCCHHWPKAGASAEQQLGPCSHSALCSGCRSGLLAGHIASTAESPAKSDAAVDAEVVAYLLGCCAQAQSMYCPEFNAVADSHNQRVQSLIIIC